MTEEKKPKRIKQLLTDGIQCSYVRFHDAVPPAQGSEPVSEFKTESDNPKYKVDQISHDNHTLYWRRGKVIEETPWVHVKIARPIM